MFVKTQSIFAIALSILIFSCAGKEENQKVDTEAKSNAENKYSVSLKDAAEKFSKAEHDHDSNSFFTYIDSNFAVTARGQTHVVQSSQFAGFKQSMTNEFTDTAMIITTTYDIKETQAGSVEPVWAGYDKGMVTQTAISKDGKYNRKITGPYFRAWKLDNGQWKCYEVVYMAFTCEGNDCK